MDTVAIIGAGPAGLVAARWLQREGFDVVLFERGAGLGGQWSAEPGRSGVWPGMHTNTCREMTQFSDLEHAPGTPRYPAHEQMLAYLVRYAELFQVDARIRTRTRVTALRREEDGRWRVESADAAGVRRRAVFDRVVVASGRFQKPQIPAIPGLGSFTGDAGVIAAFDYKGPERYRGRKVLVAGCAVSALEIACDLAGAGAARVVTANRRQRYVLPKMFGGVPVEYLIQTRRAGWLQEKSPAAVGRALKAVALAGNGDPRACGAPAPDDDLLQAGATQCQNYLALVAEGRIDARPWIASVEGRSVRFLDGRCDAFDGLVFGTGFELHLPFFDDAVRRQLGLAEGGLGLYRGTFHPDLPGLAFLGQFQTAGPYLPPIELQARWIAYAWSGARPLPEADAMRAHIAARAGAPDKHHMPLLTLQFAREAGVEPELAEWPELHAALVDGPLTPVSFRLQGRDALLDAPARVSQAAVAGERLRDWLRASASAFRDVAAAGKTIPTALTA